MIKKYLDNYYKNQITQREMAEKLGVREHKIKGMINDLGLCTVNETINKLDFNDKELRRTLRNKYTSLANRCMGTGKYEGCAYDGREYLPVTEWVEFCNANRDIIKCLWSDYIDSGKELSCSVTIDRIDDGKGYIVDNMQFVRHSYNSWKGQGRPCEVIHKGEKYYFMSTQEGSEYFNIRRQTIGECLRGDKSASKDFIVKEVSADKVLANSGCRDLKEYYYKYVLKD